jgi:CheY-like chemotaxis protein
MGQVYPIRKSATILVVEDEALIAEMITDALEEQGFDIFIVSNAADALSYIESGAQVDALFTDVHLPGNMNGSELATRVRALRPDMPIVYASGRWHPTEHEQLVPRSVFLQKPYDPHEAGSLLMRLVSKGDLKPKIRRRQSLSERKARR